MTGVIVVAGEALIDEIRSPDGRIERLPGGGPYNTARTIGRLGGSVRFLGRLSTDTDGRRLRVNLAADGVDVAAAPATTDPTMLAIADLDAAGTATYRFETDGTAARGLTAADVRAALVDPPAAVHVGTLGLVLEPMAGVLADAIERLSADTLVMIDPNCRPSAITDRSAYFDRLGRLVARADVVKASVDDLAFITPGVPPRDVARRFVASGAGLVLVTDGPGDVVAVTAGFEMTLPVPRAEVVDTVGCGDAFGGGFLAWWIEQGSGRDDLADRTAVEVAVRRAIEVASLTAQRGGATPPTRAEAGWPARRP